MRKRHASQYANFGSLPKGGQSVQGTQIVYKTKSDLNVFVILQRYAIFYLIKDFTVNKDFPLHRVHAEERHLPPGKYPVPYSHRKY